MNRLSAEDFKTAPKLPLTLVLDNVRSLHNIGSVFRTSDAFLVEKVILCGISSCPPQPEIHKTALGAEFTVDWMYEEDCLQAIKALREQGYIIYAAEQATGSICLQDLRLDSGQKYALVLGNEVKGVQQEVIDLCHHCVEIPQYGTKHSLNVSVASGILVWSFFEQLRKRL